MFTNASSHGDSIPAIHLPALARNEAAWPAALPRSVTTALQLPLCAGGKSAWDDHITPRRDLNFHVGCAGGERHHGGEVQDGKEQVVLPKAQILSTFGALAMARYDGQPGRAAVVSARQHQQKGGMPFDKSCSGNSLSSRGANE